MPHRYRRITLPTQEEIIYHLWQDGIPFTPQYPDALKQRRSAFSSDIWREGKGRTRGISGLRKSSILCAIFDTFVIGASHKSKGRSFHYCPDTQSAEPIEVYLRKSALTVHSLLYLSTQGPAISQKVNPSQHSPIQYRDIVITAQQTTRLEIHHWRRMVTTQVATTSGQTDPQSLQNESHVIWWTVTVSLISFNHIAVL